MPARRTRTRIETTAVAAATMNTNVSPLACWMASSAGPTSIAAASRIRRIGPSSATAIGRGSKIPAIDG